MMPRSIALVFALATLSAGTYAFAADPAGQQTSSGADSNAQQTQAPAPIVHAYGGQSGAVNSNQQANPAIQPAHNSVVSHPVTGVTVRSTADASVEKVSTDPKVTELRIAHGVADVSVHHPGKDVRVLVDLPGGQTALLKDGLYTFNADTNIVRVLKGEADAYPGAAVNGVRLKEDHQFAFAASATQARSVVSSREDLMADYLPGNAPSGDGPVRAGYGYAPYGDGFYGYPYGYGYGYPYGYGFGLGFGYYGGFGGFRGGGFHGRFR